MPKPVLSDSLFNADDVATAILNKANLSITNQDLGVVDITDLITATSPANIGNTAFYTFNGFAFICFTFDIPNSVNMTNIGSIKSGYEPIKRHVFPSISYQGDSANYVVLQTNGNVETSLIQNVGDSHYYGVINGFYRFT
tara:strand:- start:565 stop:984 length:420 start_codon:yes stop_codon:yes gene_type:complete